MKGLHGDGVGVDVETWERGGVAVDVGMVVKDECRVVVDRTEGDAVCSVLNDVSPDCCAADAVTNSLVTVLLVDGDKPSDWMALGFEDTL